MLKNTNRNTIRYFKTNANPDLQAHFIFTLFFLLGVLAIFNTPVYTQGPVNGGFAGQVTDNETKSPIAGATVKFINQANGFQTAKKSDQNGQFYQDTLPPGDYVIEVAYSGYTLFRKTQSLYATRSNSIIPVPVALVKETVAVTTNPNPTASPSPTTTPPTTTAPGGNQANAASSDTDENINLNPRRDGAFNEFMVRTLPLGGTTLTRSFDELAFLVPGVLPPPQAIGNTVGPGVGGGVGTSGQFSVNGLRSRANNFTVDGSDNNDEDIGVRRQGFFALVPQPIESIQEFQIITLLAPAQYGRNLGAQVNALSKSGGNRFHGTIYGLFNFDLFNARNFFDNADGDSFSNLQGRRTDGTLIPVFVNGSQHQEFYDAGEKDVFTLLQGGFAVGGRLVKDKLFFFVSGELQSLDATKESNFAVPTVEQRGLFGSGATGLITTGNNPAPVFPTSASGDAVFSLFPFPNNPDGVYGRNTYTQSLSADAKGLILSGRFDWNIFKVNGNRQTFTARYNFTDDERDLTDVGGALFSQIRPLVRTDNFSTFLAGSLTSNVSNEFRFSWGRTTLEFEEIRDGTGFLRPVTGFNSNADTRFLLNAQVFENFTLPGNLPGLCVAGTVCYRRQGFVTQTFAPNLPSINNPMGNPTDGPLGAIGQLIVAGFSPVGVDVFNFPQERENNTYQFADTVRWQIGRHAFAFGTDIRRTVLDSNLPRNSRPLVTFYGGRDLRDTANPGLASSLDLAASGAATGFFQNLALPNFDSRISLSYYQLNFFVQDEWRFSSNFIINLGLRYEYNTPPKEADNKIEDTFNALQSQFPDLVEDSDGTIINIYRGFQDFIAGRTDIYDSDRNNFAPRIGFAWDITGKGETVVRGGYGIYYDQIIGAVVSQSRNVFPNFTTINTGGGELICNLLGEIGTPGQFTLLNPINGTYSPNSCGSLNRFNLVQPGTLNTLNPQFPDRRALLTRLLTEFPYTNGTTYGATIPTRELDIPLSHQYSIGIEQRLFGDTFLSAAYVGTLGRELLRFTTPNLGSNFLTEINNIVASSNSGGFPLIYGRTRDPIRLNRNLGPINQFETTGRSRYDSLQIALRGRLTRSFRYQMNYVYGKVEDDVSDVFDLAGAFALPQNSRTFEGEYAPANFDVRHRFTYNFVYDLPLLDNRSEVVKFFFGGWQISGTGKFNTGQPFTVNSIFDINRDGNLTDRLNNTQFITETGDNQNPLQLNCTTARQCQLMLAPIGSDGAAPRNSFRAGKVLELDLSFSKRFAVRENQSFQLRVDVFNFINRANFGVPVRFLEAPGFGRATDTVTPGRRIQFGLKYVF